MKLQTWLYLAFYVCLGLTSVFRWMENRELQMVSIIAVGMFVLGVVVEEDSLVPERQGKR